MSGAGDHYFTSFDGLRLYARISGPPAARATPLLCLPGLTRNSRDFVALARRHAGDRLVICPDLRGRGRSERAPDWRSYQPRTYLEDLRHLLAALGVAGVVVVGTSMGGLLGTALAAAMPGVLRAIVVNDVGPDIDPGGAARILRYIGADRPQPDWDAAAAHLRTTFPKLSFRTDEEWLAFAHATFREGDDGQLHFDWDVRLAKPLLSPEPEPLDLWALWRALGDRPALAIRGGLSDILSPATLERMRAEKPDLLTVTVEGVGHVPTLQEPVAREAVDAFIRRF